MARSARRARRAVRVARRVGRRVARRTSGSLSGLGSGFALGKLLPAAAGGAAGFILAERGRQMIGRNMTFAASGWGAVAAEAIIGVVGGMLLRRAAPALAASFSVGALARAGVSAFNLVRPPSGTAGMGEFDYTLGEDAFVGAPDGVPQLGYLDGQPVVVNEFGEVFAA